jgi:hypothetical protein
LEKGRQNGSGVWRRERESVKRERESVKRERKSVDKRDGRPACISFFITDLIYYCGLSHKSTLIFVLASI